MWSTADIGIRFRSTACDPVPTLPDTFTTLLTCLRLPLTSTKTWSGLRPRMVAVRTIELASPPAWLGSATEGSRSASASCRPALPVFCRSVAVITSIGVALLPTDRRTPRAPVTTMASD